MNREILDYIRKNINTYSRQAIEKELLQHGFSREEIQEAWEESSRIPSDGFSPQEMDKFWLIFRRFFLGVPILLIPCWMLILMAFKFDNNNSWNAFITLFWFVLISGLIASLILWNKRSVVARGLLAGVLCLSVVGFSSIFIITGICVNSSRY